MFDIVRYTYLRGSREHITRDGESELNKADEVSGGVMDRFPEFFQRLCDKIYYQETRSNESFNKTCDWAEGWKGIDPDRKNMSFKVGRKYIHIEYTYTRLNGGQPRLRGDG